MHRLVLYQDSGDRIRLLWNGKEADERHQKLISQAKKEQAELYQQGIKSEVLREEPFVTAQDELDYKVYLMIYKWQGKNRGVNVRRIN